MVIGEMVGRPMEILLVEDSLVFSRVTIGALRNSELPHRLTWVTDGEDALAFVRKTGKYRRVPRPDLILLDLGLPRKDGREVLAELRADPDLCHIPVIILTSSDDEEDIVATEKLQVQGYLTKPINQQKFLSTVYQLNNYWLKDMVLPAETNS